MAILPWYLKPGNEQICNMINSWILLNLPDAERCLFVHENYLLYTTFSHACFLSRWNKSKWTKTEGRVSQLLKSSLSPYIANFGVEKIMWFNLQLRFLLNDALPPQLLQRTYTFYRNLNIKSIAQSTSSIVATCFDRLIRTNTDSRKRQWGFLTKHDLKGMVKEHLTKKRSLSTLQVTFREVLSLACAYKQFFTIGQYIVMYLVCILMFPHPIKTKNTHCVNLSVFQVNFQWR